MSSTNSHPDHPDQEAQRHDLEEEAPRLEFTRRHVILFLLFVVATIAFLYYVLPQIAGLEDTWERIERGGDPVWLFVALVLTIASFGGYVVLFNAVFVRPGSPIDLRASYQITMASLAATRIFGAGGVGGIALTAWALRRAGMPRREVADQTLAFLILQYSIYTVSLVVLGLGLRTGILPGPAPFAVTVVPAIFGAIAILIALALALVPTDLQRRLDTFVARGGRLARIAQRLANVPASFSAGMRSALDHVRRNDPALAGALVFWLCNIGTLWASFHAFGHAPSIWVIAMGFWVGMLGNLLPLPGGVGGVDGAMIGAFSAFGVDFGLATVAVLVYRAFAFWLPTIPGLIAYFQLRKTVRRWGEGRREHELAPAGV
jgi:putative heme transporter